MCTLKLLTNGLKFSNTGLIRFNNNWKKQQLWICKRTKYSTSIFIRNTGDSVLSSKIYKNNNTLSKQGSLLAQFPAFVCDPNPYYNFSTKNVPDRANKSDAKSAAVAEVDLFGDASKLGLFAKFKLMYKKYWYVLIPVHVVTSMGWMCGFYYLSKSGVDIPSLLQYLHLSETIIEKVKYSNLGHWAVAYLCYKVATPVRYAVTLGGTTVSIKHLVQHGYIKPMPTREDIVRMYEEQKAHRAAVKANAEKEHQQGSQNK